MSFSSAAMNVAARNHTVVTISLSQELKAQLLALQEKMPLQLLQGVTPMSNILSVLRALQEQWKNKKLTTQEHLALEEYKLILIESCRTSLSELAPIPFKIPKHLRSQLPKVHTLKHFPTLNLLNQRITNPVSIDELMQEFSAVQTYLRSKDTLPAQKEILKNYRDFILQSPHFKQSGLTETYHDTKHRESFWKNLGKRLSFALPQLAQIISNGCLYLVELLGKSSLLTFIPNIANPITLSVSIGLITVSSILDFAFGMKLFKDTYGISFFGQISKTHLSYCEKQIAATKNINQMLADTISCRHLSAEAYKEYCQLAYLLNKNNKNKITNPNGEFARHKEYGFIKTIRWGLLLLCALLTVNSSYFAGASLLTLATGSTLITPIGWLFIAGLIVSSLALLYLQQKNSTFSLLNPTYERFAHLKSKGLKLSAEWQLNKSHFEENLAQKMEHERSDVAPVAGVPEAAALPANAPTVVQKQPPANIGLSFFSSMVKNKVSLLERLNVLASSTLSGTSELPEAGSSLTRKAKK